MANGARPSDLTRTILATLSLGVMIAASFWILQPFLASTVWAAMIVVATWPLLLSLQDRLWGKRGLAVAVMTTLLLLVLVVPIALALATIFDQADEVYGWLKDPAHLALSGPPDWVGRIPVVGARLADKWREVAASGPAALARSVEPFAKSAVLWLAAKTGSFGLLLVKMLLTIVISAIFYSGGEKAAEGALRFARRLAGGYGESSVILAAKSVRAVALGVGVTALIQAGLGGLGLAVCGVPGAAVLTAIIFMLCVAQLGPALVLVPSVVWLYGWAGEPLWGTVLLVCTILVSTLDNFIRPLLIKKGVDLPLLLIFSGVIGGLLGFGVIGLFIGPVTLAVVYTLVTAWIEAGDAETPEPPTPEG